LPGALHLAVFKPPWKQAFLSGLLDRKASKVSYIQEFTKKDQKGLGEGALGARIGLHNDCVEGNMFY
jgi:hypothetical protein